MPDDWDLYAMNRAPHRRFWMRVAATVFTVLAVVGLGAGYLLWEAQPRPIRRLTDVENWTGIQFPEGSRLVGGIRRWGFTSRVSAQVTIPRRLTKQFVSQPFFTSVRREDGRILAYGGDAIVIVTVLAGDSLTVEVDWGRL